MRTLFEDNYNGTRVTGFEYESKYSLKFEKFHLEQWFKFRDGSIKDTEALQGKTVELLLPNVEARFVDMMKDRADTFNTLNSDDISEFQTII